MWQSDLATGSSVLHSTNGLPTPPSEEPSPPRHDESPDISPGHRRKRVGGAPAESARKHAVHEHRFDHEKAPLSTVSQALKIVANCQQLSTEQQKMAIQALKAKVIDADVIIGLEGTSHLIDELKEGIGKLASQAGGL